MAIRPATAPGNTALSQTVRILAGPSLKPLWGKVIVVDQMRLLVGRDGHMTVLPYIAKRLLAQSGWARYVEPTPGDGAGVPGATEKTTSPPAPPNKAVLRGRKKKFR